MRKIKTVVFIQVMVLPVAQVHYWWMLKRDDNLYKMNHTGQVCRLRKVLNDKVDSELRRITITDGNSFPRKYIYTEAENKPKFLGKLFIYSNEDYIGSGSDFVVNIPPGMTDNQLAKIKAYCDFYKMAGKRYRIEILTL
ncbi:hypothetical protein [Flavobacterium gilvum]|nr:hypothetical protein [Flavobacterium gilvum]